MESNRNMMSSSNISKHFNFEDMTPPQFLHAARKAANKVKHEPSMHREYLTALVNWSEDNPIRFGPESAMGRLTAIIMRFEDVEDVEEIDDEDVVSFMRVIQEFFGSVTAADIANIENWEATTNMSPNLLLLFGKPKSKPVKVETDWKAPTKAGLSNSDPHILVDKNYKPFDFDSPNKADGGEKNSPYADAKEAKRDSRESEFMQADPKIISRAGSKARFSGGGNGNDNGRMSRSPSQQPRSQGTMIRNESKQMEKPEQDSKIIQSAANALYDNYNRLEDEDREQIPRRQSQGSQRAVTIAGVREEDEDEEERGAKPQGYNEDSDEEPERRQRLGDSLRGSRSVSQVASPAPERASEGGDGDDEEGEEAGGNDAGARGGGGGDDEEEEEDEDDEDDDEDYDDDDDDDDDEDYGYGDDDDDRDVMSGGVTMSANLMRILGLDTSNVDTTTDWKPPERSGIEANPDSLKYQFNFNR